MRIIILREFLVAEALKAGVPGAQSGGKLPGLGIGGLTGV